MKTINRKVKRLIVTTVLALSILFSLILYGIYRQFAESSIEKKSFLIETVIKNESRKFADEIFDSRFESIKLHADELMRIKGIILVDVFNADSKSLITGADYDMAKIKTDGTKTSIATISRDGNDILQCYFPVTVLEEVIGYIKVEYSLDEITSAARNIALFSLLLIIAFSISVGAALQFYLTKNVIRPIETLVGYIQESVKDDEKINIVVNRDNEATLRDKLSRQGLNEVEVLEASFKLLMLRIKRYSDHIEEDIKTLKGMLPICSNCKKIRDDKGYWHMVEVYIHDHSNAEFTHGICPDCIKKLYPGISSKIPK